MNNRHSVTILMDIKRYVSKRHNILSFSLLLFSTRRLRYAINFSLPADYRKAFFKFWNFKFNQVFGSHGWRKRWRNSFIRVLGDYISKPRSSPEVNRGPVIGEVRGAEGESIRSSQTTFENPPWQGEGKAEWWKVYNLRNLGKVLRAVIGQRSSYFLPAVDIRKKSMTTNGKTWTTP